MVKLKSSQTIELVLSLFSAFNADNKRKPFVSINRPNVCAFKILPFILYEENRDFLSAHKRNEQTEFRVVLCRNNAECWSVMGSVRLLKPLLRTIMPSLASHCYACFSRVAAVNTVRSRNGRV